MKPEEWDVRFDNVFPYILKQVQACKPASFLDYGCGPGAFLSMVQPHVSSTAYGYDLSPKIREQARRATPAKIVDDMTEIPRGSIDAVTMNAVWMQFPTEETCMDVLRGIHDVLKPGGIFIASITHPCFRDHNFVTHQTDFKRGDYLKSGSPFRVYVGGPKAPHGIWDDFHWTLSDHINQLVESGLCITRITEVPDANGLSQWMIIEAEKPA